jgi:hypothetical protein
MVETEDESIGRVSPGARLAAGVIAGMIAGMLVLGFMMACANATGAGLTMPLKALGVSCMGLNLWSPDHRRC